MKRATFFRTQDTHTYLHNLAIAVRSYEDNSILDFDGEYIYNSNGFWDYRKAIAEEKKALRDFVYNNSVKNGENQSETSFF